MTLGKEHIPQTQLLSLLLQLLNNSRCGGPSLLALTELSREGSFGGDALLLDEFLDLEIKKISSVLHKRLKGFIVRAGASNASKADK